VAKKKKTTVTEEILPDQSEELSPLYAPEEDLLARAAEDLGSGLATIKVYLVLKTGKPEYLTEFAADDSDSIIAEIARRYGGGAYLARFFGEDGLLQRAPVRFNVAGVVKPQGDAEAETDGGDFKSRILEKLLTKVIEGGGATNPAAVTAAMIQASTAQASALMSVMMPMMQKMMEMKQQPAMPTELMAEMFHAGVELAGSKDDPSPMGLVERFASILERVQSHGQRSPSVGAAPAAPLAAPDTQVAPTARVESVGADAVGRVSAPGWLKVLQPHINDLLEAAKDGVPPALVAAAIIDRAPATADWLVDQPVTFVESLLDAVPQLKPFEGWVREVFQALRDADDGDGGDGDGGDVPLKVVE
jgi:hypothetical protein